MVGGGDDPLPGILKKGGENEKKPGGKPGFFVWCLERDSNPQAHKGGEF